MKRAHMVASIWRICIELKCWTSRDLRIWYSQNRFRCKRALFLIYAGLNLRAYFKAFCKRIRLIFVWHVVILCCRHSWETGIDFRFIATWANKTIFSFFMTGTSKSIVVIFDEFMNYFACLVNFLVAISESLFP